MGFILGDLLAQHLAHHAAGPAAPDWARASRVGAYGLALDGPLGALWYDLLVRRQGVGGQGPLGARG